MNKPKKLSKQKMGVCVECGQACLVQDDYIVRSEIWHEAGMKYWDSGYLHRPCLEKRIGRTLRPAELLVWFKHEKKPGKCIFTASSDYLTSPEFLLYPDATRPVVKSEVTSSFTSDLLGGGTPLSPVDLICRELFSN